MNPLLPPELELFYQSHWGERWPALRDAILDSAHLCASDNIYAHPVTLKPVTLKPI